MVPVLTFFTTNFFLLVAAGRVAVVEAVLNTTVSSVEAESVVLTLTTLISSPFRGVLPVDIATVNTFPLLDAVTGVPVKLIVFI